jgi:hypothetical protein
MHLALPFPVSKYGRLGSATDAKILPEPKPGAAGLPFVVPSIGSRDVACAEWSNIRRFEHLLQLLDVVNDAFNVHSVPISNMRVAIVKRNTDHWAELVGLAHIPPAVHGNSLTRHVVIHGKHDGDSGNVLH